MTRSRMARADRRDQLVDVAGEVFFTHGFAPSSMEDVAERAGVTKPVLYDHFGSKDGLLAAVITALGATLLEATAAAAEQESTSEGQLAAGLTAYFRFVEQHRGAWALLLAEVSPGTEAAAAADAVRTAQVELAAAAIDAHLPVSDLARATVYAQAISGAAERLAAVHLEDLSSAVQDLMDLVWVGFSCVQTGVRWEGRT